MNRCGISRKDGVIRIGILCDQCAIQAMQKLDQEGRRFWVREYHGSEACEACLIHEYNDKLERRLTDG